MSGILPRLRSALHTGMRQQVTRTGVVFTASLVLIAVSAFASANNLLFLILAAMLSTLLVSGFSQPAVSRRPRGRVLSSGAHFGAHAHTGEGRRSRNLKWIPSYSIRLSAAEGSGMESQLYYPTIPGGAKLEEHVTLPLPCPGHLSGKRRGLLHRVPVRFHGTKGASPAPAADSQSMRRSSREPEFDHLLAELSGEVEVHFRGDAGTIFIEFVPMSRSRVLATWTGKQVRTPATSRSGSSRGKKRHRRCSFLDLECAAPGAVFETIVDCCACVSGVSPSRRERDVLHAGSVHASAG